MLIITQSKHSMTTRPSLSTIGAILMLGLAIAATPLRAAELTNYLLGTQDKVKVDVIEWLSGEGKYRDWESVSGEYTVSVAGTISIPLLGSITARGRSSEELSNEIATRLMQHAQLPTKPQAAVQVIGFRPLYVSGDVENPGEFAFRPDLTVAKAIALAGGIYRGSSNVNARGTRDWIHASSLLEEAMLNLRRAIVRRARLYGELSDLSDEDAADAGKITPRYPHAVTRDEEIERLVADEHRIRLARIVALRSRTASFRALTRLLIREQKALEHKLILQREALELVKRQGESISRLSEKNLVDNTRILGMKKLIRDTESALLDLETALLRVGQDISKAERDALDTHNTVRATVTAELQETEAQIDILEAKIRTARALVIESGFPSDIVVDGRGGSEIVHELRYEVHRPAPAGTITRLAATEDTAVLPGDLIKVHSELKQQRLERRPSPAPQRMGAQSSSAGPAQGFADARPKERRQQ